MPIFPSRESDIAILARRMFIGLHNNPVYPAPPVSAIMLAVALSTYQNAAFAATEARAGLASAAAEKDAALDVLVEGIKANLRYAENTVNFDDDRLKLIGWSGRKTPTALAPPGQPRELEAPRQGEGFIFLDWKKPVYGGKPSAYTIERRIPEEDDKFQTVATALDTETTLVSQPTGKTMEFRIIAVNKAGQGPASNTVSAVL